MPSVLVLPTIHAQAQSRGNGIVIEVVTTARAYAWFLSGTDPNSGWGRLCSFNSSIAQAIQGLVEASATLPQSGTRLVLKMNSKALLNAIREERNLSRRLSGLMRYLREQLSGHIVQVGHVEKSDGDYKDKLAVLMAGERAGVLPVAFAGEGLLKFSNYDGIEAVAPAHTAMHLLRKPSSFVERTYEREGAIRAVRYDEEGNRFPPLHRPPAVPMVLDQIMACADRSNEGDLLAQIEARTTALTITDVAQLFGVSGETIRRMAAKKQIPGFRVGGSIRSSPACLGYWLRQRDQLAAKASKERPAPSDADYALADRSSVEGVA